MKNLTLALVLSIVALQNSWSATIKVTLSEGASPYETTADEITSTTLSSYKTTMVAVEVDGDLTSIGQDAFRDYTLQSIVIKGNVGAIGQESFRACTSLETFEITGDLGTIGKEAFNGCTAIKTFTVGGSITEIGQQAFLTCYALKSFEINSSITSIGESAFRDCTTMETFVVHGDLGTIDQYAFMNCTLLKTFTVEGSITEIGKDAFDICYALESFEVHNSIDLISEDAFRDCTSLKSFEVYGDVGKIESNAFRNCQALETFVVDGSIDEICTEAFNYCISLETFTVEGSIGKIDEGAFFDCASLETFTVGGYIGSIGKNSFGGNCQNVKIVFGVINFDADIDAEAFGTNKVTIVAPKGYYEFYAQSEWGKYCEIECEPFVDENGNSYYYYMTEDGDLELELCGIPEDATSVVIPQTVTLEDGEEYNVSKIVDGIFSNASSLEKITVYWPEPIEATAETFEGTKNVILYVPVGTKEVYQVWKDYFLAILDGTETDDEPSSTDNDDDNSNALINTTIEREEIGRYNILGQKSGKEGKGIIIVKYSDGTTEKIIVK